MNKVALVFYVFGDCRRQKLVNVPVTVVGDRKSAFSPLLTKIK